MKAKKNPPSATIVFGGQSLINDFGQLANNLKKSLMFFSTTRVASFDSSAIKSKVSNLFSSSRGRDNPSKFKKYVPLLILLAVLVGVLVISVRFFQTSFSPESTATDGRIELKEARGKMPINKNYEFPILDDKGKEFTKLKFILDSAELRDEIILNGQKATLIKGKTYLVVTIKLTNKSDKFINMKVRNYIRLGLNNNKEDWAAAEVYNDPVEVQPLSTKQTRLAFPINETDKNWILKVGDLDGKKEDIQLKFN